MQFNLFYVYFMFVTFVIKNRVFCAHFVVNFFCFISLIAGCNFIVGTNTVDSQ